MTAWGFADCQRDPTAPGYGSTLGRLFLRTLPNNYSHDSTYTWFPLMTPDAMSNVLTNLGDVKKYDLGKPQEFTGVPQVTSYRDVSDVLKNPKKFAAAHQARCSFIVKGQGYDYPLNYSTICLFGGCLSASSSLLMILLVPKGNNVT